MIRKVLNKLATLGSYVSHYLIFFVLVYIYFCVTILELISVKLPKLDTILKFAIRSFYGLADKLDRSPAGDPAKLDLIRLAMQSMNAKRTRTFITVGGMTLGISVIVFFVSLGYGLQALVVNRVARLEEMRQTDVTVAAGSKIKLSDDTLATFEGIPDVVQALPVINVVGKVSFNNSVTDLAVYGVTKDYLDQSAIKPVIGKTFDSNELSVRPGGRKSSSDNSESTVVAEIGEKVADMKVEIDEGIWLAVRDKASGTGQVLGYISSDVGELSAEEVWGEAYIDNSGYGRKGVRSDGTSLGLWLKVRTALWSKEDGQYIPISDGDGNLQYVTGYFARINIKVLEFDNTVLGNSVEVANPEFITIDEDLPELQDIEVVEVSPRNHEAVVNRAFLNILSIPENEILGKTFEVTFIATGNLLENDQKQLQSEPVTYTIIGVTPDDRTPQIYVPFVDVRSMGIQNFSQIKIISRNESSLSAVRQIVEGLGYNTYSVTDTVSQIGSLFSTVRLMLGLLGMIALGIASLGMFNTLTVSLIERTREVGLLKAMGMKSNEIRDLFFAESILMGSLGGILGIMLGFAAGKLVELVLSIFSILRGVGALTIVEVPLTFTFMIIMLSFVVGLLTGIYPARRATKISALNALRYE